MCRAGRVVGDQLGCLIKRMEKIIFFYIVHSLGEKLEMAERDIAIHLQSF